MNSNLQQNYFYGYSNDEKFNTFSFKWKYSYLLTFSADLEKYKKVKPTKLSRKKEKVFGIVGDLYNDQFEKYYDEYEELQDAKKIELDGKYKCINVELKDYDYKEIFPEEKSEKEEKSYDVPPGIKILTLSKLLTRLIYQHK